MFNWVDGVIILVLVFYAIDGVRRGFVEQLLELLGFAMSVLLSFWTYGFLEHWIIAHFNANTQLAGPVAFVAILVLLEAIYSLSLKFIYPLIPAKVRTAQVNKIAGVITAIVRSIVLLSVILVLLVGTPITPANGASAGPLEKLRTEIQGSVFGGELVAKSTKVEAFLSRIFGKDLSQSLTFLTVPAQNEQIIGPGDSVDLKFTTTNVTVDTASEQKMFALVNEERAKVGLPALQWDEELAKVARAHSKDMFRRGYFSHTDPDGLSPFDRMQNVGIQFKAAGENIAYAATVEIAHTGLMNSPGHRANILEKNFGKIGIGVIDAGPYGKMFTQDFTD